jgi:hypothetical protein
MLVFIHINKTAGRTIRHILRSSYGLHHCEVEPWHARWSDPPFSTEDLYRLRKIYPQLESIAGHRLTGYTDLQENGTQFKYFTFMRDPLKTCASRFQYNVQYRKKEDLVFEEWIQKDWTRNQQIKRIAGVEDIDHAIQLINQKNIFVGLTERFDESVLLLKGLFAKNLDISYQRVNVARDNSIAKNLLSSEKSRQLLIEANQVDINLYDYVQNELFPSYQSEYGEQLEADLSNYQQSRENKFNNWNLTLSRIKQYLLYKPLLSLYRKGIRVV